ncbi:hypothetical protein Ms3S1_01970 [Methylosinus sp. 3S-1]
MSRVRDALAATAGAARERERIATASHRGAAAATTPDMHEIVKKLMTKPPPMQRRLENSTVVNKL